MRYALVGLLAVLFIPALSLAGDRQRGGGSGFSVSIGVGARDSWGSHRSGGYVNTSVRYSNSNHASDRNYNRPIDRNYNRPIDRNYNRPLHRNYNRPLYSNYNRATDRNYSRPLYRNYNSYHHSSRYGHSFRGDFYRPAPVYVHPAPVFIRPAPVYCPPPVRYFSPNVRYYGSYRHGSTWRR